MEGFLEINYISPVSNYRFNKTDKYFLVFSNIVENIPTIHKIVLSSLCNINRELRAIIIKKTVGIFPNQNPNFKVNLFKFSKDKNRIYLIFTGEININKTDYNHKSYIVMKEPPRVNNEFRNTELIDYTSFLNEKFFNFDTRDGKNVCILFFMKLQKPRTIIIKPIKCNIYKTKNIFIYDRYSDNLIKENIPKYIDDIISSLDPKSQNKIHNIHFIHTVNFISNFCQIDNHKNYTIFLNKYQIDTNPYKATNNKNFSGLYTRKISPKYRPLKYEPYTNNLLTSPADCRMRGFQINNSLKFLLYDTQLDINNIIDKPHQIMGGNGFLCRMAPQDYQRFHLPYSAYLKEIGIFGNMDIKDSKIENIIKNPYFITLKFESDYYMPPDVHERDYLAVIYGNHMHGGVGVGAGLRYYPELLKKQPNTKLIFYLVLVGSVYKDSIRFTNAKLKDIKKIVQINTVHRIKPQWYEQGEEIGYFYCGGGSILGLFNREIDFTSDIKHFSKMENYKKGDVQIDCLIKARDLIGAMQ